MKVKFKTVSKKTAAILVAVGAINWGLTVFNFNLVDTLLGAGSTFAKIVYTLVGISGVWALIKFFE